MPILVPIPIPNFPKVHILVLACTCTILHVTLYKWINLDKTLWKLITIYITSIVIIL